MEGMNDFYVYRHLRNDTGSPCYIGKGRAHRATDLRWRRNKHHLGIIARYGITVEIMLGNLSESVAFAKEVEFIRLYKGLGYCEANYSLGGSGGDTRTGKKHNAETKRKISVALQGKKHTTLRRQRQRDAKLGVKISSERSAARRKPRGSYGPRKDEPIC